MTYTLNIKHVSEKGVDYDLGYLLYMKMCVHNNPVEAGFVTEPHHWKYSSAANYSGELGILEIDKLG